MDCDMKNGKRLLEGRLGRKLPSRLESLEFFLLLAAFVFVISLTRACSMLNDFAITFYEGCMGAVRGRSTLKIILCNRMSSFSLFN